MYSHISRVLTLLCVPGWIRGGFPRETHTWESLPQKVLMVSTQLSASLEVVMPNIDRHKLTIVGRCR
uniref:Putative secreted protein n=1 Tax=Anopheles marajoara TaxID=58244 RepID=A0A2M4CFH7_9DIPT